VIRHGEAEHLIMNRIGSWTDVQLTSRGLLQAEALGSRLERILKGVDFQIYSSDLKRAAQTAKIIGKALGMIPLLEPRLREFNAGDAAGMTRGEATKIHREPTKPFLDWQPYPNSETWREFYVRVSAFLQHLTENCSCIPVVVAHGGTLTNIVGWWLGLDMEILARVRVFAHARNRVSFKVAPTSLTILGTSNLGERTLERLNDVNHLLSAGLLEDKIL
jgi:broad specificity phosphatase PhoE